MGSFFNLILSFAIYLHANSLCPEWLTQKTKDIPTCAKGKLLSENYPAAAVIVSDVGRGGSSFAADTVKKILIASKDKIPLLILPVTPQTIKEIQTEINSLPVSEEQKQKYKKSVRRIPVENKYKWQQDYMQSFIEPNSGKIALRRVQGYHDQDISDLTTIISAMYGSCGIQIGPVLENNGMKAGHGGGNIEALPQGICLLGDDHLSEKEWNEYSKQVCNDNPDDKIKVPTSWLKVGHTDEIIKVVRNKKTSPPCDFSVVIASPNKALELLKENRKEKFLDFSNAPESIPESLLKNRFRTRALMAFCRKRNKNIKRYNDDYKKSVDEGGISKLFNLKFLSIEKAEAQEQFDKDCNLITNGEIYNIISKDGDLMIYNQLIQEKLNALKLEVKEKLRKKLPTCNTDFIDAPDLFFGGKPVQISEDKFELPYGMAQSILPSPANAITINDTVISSDPSNGAFRKYIDKEYKNRGLSSEFVDTFDYAHTMHGNLHCSTNTFHICNPETKNE